MLDATCCTQLQVYEGLLKSTADKFSSGASVLRLWRNEVLRVLHDRLICPEDKALMQEKIGEIVHRRSVSMHHPV